MGSQRPVLSREANIIKHLFLYHRDNQESTSFRALHSSSHASAARTCLQLEHCRFDLAAEVRPASCPYIAGLSLAAIAPKAKQPGPALQRLSLCFWYSDYNLGRLLPAMYWPRRTLHPSLRWGGAWTGSWAADLPEQENFLSQTRARSVPLCGPLCFSLRLRTASAPSCCLASRGRLSEAVQRPGTTLFDGKRGRRRPKILQPPLSMRPTGQ